MNLLLWSNTNIYENRTKLIQITIADTFQVETRTIFRLYDMLYSIQYDPVWKLRGGNIFPRRRRDC